MKDTLKATSGRFCILQMHNPFDVFDSGVLAADLPDQFIFLVVGIQAEAGSLTFQKLLAVAVSSYVRVGLRYLRSNEIVFRTVP